MNWLNIALIFSIFYILYSIQNIKMILKEKGYDIDIFTNPMKDHNNFKLVINREKDAVKKTRYQGILNGLYMSMIGTAVIVGYLLFGHKL